MKKTFIKIGLLLASLSLVFSLTGAIAYAFPSFGPAPVQPSAGQPAATGGNQAGAPGTVQPPVKAQTGSGQKTTPTTTTTTPPAPEYDASITNEFMTNFAKLLAFILAGISKLLLPVIMLTGALMKSDFLFSGTMNDTLLTIWGQVRDIVNIIFVVVLIVVALYNVLGLGDAGGGEAFQLKKALPKVVLGLLLVNFSYLGVRLMVDVVNVGTTIVFALPNTTSLPAKAKAELEQNKADHWICSFTDLGKKVYEQGKEAYNNQTKDGKLFDNPESSKDKETPKKDVCETVTDKDGKKVLKPTKEVSNLLTTWGIDGAVPIMALKFMRLQNLDQTSQELAKVGKGVTDLILNMIVTIVMYFMYGVSFIALFTILLARAVMLWLVIALSPVFAIQLTFPQLASQVGGGDFASKIVKTLIAPIIIGFVLSVGFMLLATMQGVDYSGTSLSSLTLKTTATNLMTSNLDTFQQLLISIGSVIFIWVGVQGASKDAIGGEIAGTIMSAAQRAGGFLASAPFLYTPLFQVMSPDGSGGHHDVSAAALLRGVQNIPHHFENQAQETARAIMPFGGTEGADSLLKRIRGGEPEDEKHLIELLKKYQPQDIAKLEGRKDTFKKLFDNPPPGMKTPEYKQLFREISEGDEGTARNKLRDLRRLMERDGLLAKDTAAAAATGGTAAAADTNELKTLEKTAGLLPASQKAITDLKNAIIANKPKAEIDKLQKDAEPAIKQARALQAFEENKNEIKEMADEVAGAEKKDNNAVLAAKEQLKTALAAGREKLKGGFAEKSKEEGEALAKPIIEAGEHLDEKGRKKIVDAIGEGFENVKKAVEAGLNKIPLPAVGAEGGETTTEVAPAGAEAPVGPAPSPAQPPDASSNKPEPQNATPPPAPAKPVPSPAADATKDAEVDKSKPPENPKP